MDKMSRKNSNGRRFALTVQLESQRLDFVEQVNRSAVGYFCTEYLFKTLYGLGMEHNILLQ